MGESAAERVAAVASDQLRPAASLVVRPSTTEALPPLASHFGGSRPYAEEGESWPHCENCTKPDSFVVQLRFADLACPDLPDLGALSLFVCWSCVGTWWVDNGPRGFHVHRYATPNEDRFVRLSLPDGHTESKTFSVSSEPGQTLPGWETIGDLVSDLSSKLDPDEPWRPFLNAREKLGVLGTYSTYVGGDPTWLEGDDRPRCTDCAEPMRHLLQFYSEDVDLLPHLGAGSLYLFGCLNHSEQFTLKYQCE